MTSKILVVAGEPSGDLVASDLVRNLKNLDPELEFFGIGGHLSRRAGVEISFDIERLALVGLAEVLKSIFTIGRVYKNLLKIIDLKKPDLAILVDYPGFNLRLAGELKARSIPVVYYVSPQVWAWGRERIKIIKECVRKIIVFFKFEEELYKTYGVDVEFVGHPLLDTVKTGRPRKDEILKKYGMTEGRLTVALLPGSRAMEIKTLLPIMINASKIIQKTLKEAQFVIAKHKDLPPDLYEKPVKDAGLNIRFSDGDTHNILSASDFAIVASGTATLETAIIGTPFIIVYKGSPLTYIAYLIVRRIPFLGIVNIILRKEAVPELIQSNATPEKIARKAIDIITDERKKNAMRDGFDSIRASLGSPGASIRAAKAILPLLRH